HLSLTSHLFPYTTLFRSRNRALNFRRGLWRRLARELESVRWFERTTDESPREREAMRCLRDLPPEQREVIVLKIWHQYTFEKIRSEEHTSELQSPDHLVC